MLAAKKQAAIFAPMRSEPDFLLFCQRIGGSTAPHSISGVLDEYFLHFLSSGGKTDGLPIGYALWDLDRNTNVSHLVAFHGFDPFESNYPIVLKEGEGIAGYMLHQMNVDGRLQPYVASNISDDSVIAAREILTNRLGYRGVIVFPVTIGDTPSGVLKVYAGQKLAKEVRTDHARLEMEAARISAVVSLGSRIAIANLRDDLSANFRDLDLLDRSQPPDVQMDRLRQTVEQCLGTIAIATSANAVELDLGHTVFASGKSSRRGGDIHTDVLMVPLGASEPHTSACLKIQSRTDHLQFSAFDRHLLSHAATLLSRYVEKYFALRDFTGRWRKRGVLLEAVGATSSALLHTFVHDEIVQHLLNGIQKAFEFSALIYLQVEGDRLVPTHSIPEEVAGNIIAQKTRLRILPRCRLQAKSDWSTADCPGCQDCHGLTTIAALRRTAVIVPDLQSTPLRPLYIDFGVPASAEYAFPIVIAGTLFGVVDLYSQAPVKISEDELYFVRSICNTAALSFYNRQLLDQVARLRLEESRGEIARDVVHTLSPTVSALDTQAHFLRDDIRALQTGRVDSLRLKKTLKDAAADLAALIDVVAQQQNIVAKYGLRTRPTLSPETALMIGPIISDVVNINMLRAEQKDIMLKTIQVGAERPLWCSELYMYLILWNLVQNAVKFTRGGRGEQVIVRCLYNDSECVITVADQGVGIKKEDRNRVWDPDFTTVAPGASSATSGQGLTIVKDLVLRIEGAAIDFTSTVNKGTEFVLAIRQGRRYVNDKSKQARAD